MPNPRLVQKLGQPSQPVLKESPLEGLERSVLKVWLENSPSVRKAYHGKDRPRVEQAVREAVDAGLSQELQLRAQGLTVLEAQELTRPAMWTPPRWPTVPKATRTREGRIRSLRPSKPRTT